MEWTGWTFGYSQEAQDLSVSFLENDLERIEITKNEFKCNKKELSRESVFCLRPKILSLLKVSFNRNKRMQISLKLYEKRSCQLSL